MIVVGVSALLSIPILITINSRYEIATNQKRILEESGAVIEAVSLNTLEDRTRLLLSKLGAPTAPSPVQYIAFVRELAPSSVSLRGFVMDNNKIPILNVSGVANTRNDLQRFVDTIKADPRVALVDSPVSNFIKSTDNDFKITVTFKK